MESIELMSRREALGLSQQLLAELLHVGQSAVGHWEAGKRGIPDGIDAEVAALEEQVDRLVEMMVETGMNVIEAGQPAVLMVYRGKWAEGPVHEGTALPAVLQRVAAARAQCEFRVEGHQIPIIEIVSAQ